MVVEYHIKIYKTATGACPFKKWFDDLKDRKAQVAIDLRLERMGMGNFGQCKVIGEGLHELKIDIGPGYRVYFGKIGLRIVLLLCAGDKKSQQKDIEKAKKYFQDYKNSGL